MGKKGDSKGERCIADCFKLVGYSLMVTIYGGVGVPVLNGDVT